MDGGRTSPMLKQFNGMGMSPNIITNSDTHLPQQQLGIALQKGRGKRNRT